MVVVSDKCGLRSPLTDRDRGEERAVRLRGDGKLPQEGKGGPELPALAFAFFFFVAVALALTLTLTGSRRSTVVPVRVL